MAFCSALADSPSKAMTSGYEMAYAGSQLSTWWIAPSRPRRHRIARPMVRMMYSTKYACQALEPAKRDLRPAREGRLSRRIAIRTRMPTTVIRPMNSM